MRSRNVFLAGCLMACVVIAGCKDPVASSLPTTGKAHIELPVKLQNEMKRLNMAKDSPIVVRIFKEENILEVWKQRRDGRYALISSYDICKWSGKLGPKFVEGDRQAPEGFYQVRPAQMNPHSQYYLAFNIGYPNAYDRANGRTGKHLMVHGACSSAGCYSMSDENIAEIYAFGRDAFKGGQREFQVQAFPFRMTSANMARYRHDPNYPFWQMIKQGYDIFETTGRPPQVDVCEKRYVFNSRRSGDGSLDPVSACPAETNDAMSVSALMAEKDSRSSILGAAVLTRKQAPSASIQGIEEARLVADWSRRRARGEKVSPEPPSLAGYRHDGGSEANIASSNPAIAKTTANIVEEVSQPESRVPESKVQESRAEVLPVLQKKRGWSLFRPKS